VLEDASWFHALKPHSVRPVLTGVLLHQDSLSSFMAYLASL